MTEPAVLLDVREGVAHITLNRPDNANAMNLDLLESLVGAVMRCHSDPDVRAVLLSGNGKAFCGGGDVKDFASKGEALPDYLRAATAYLQVAASGLIRMQAPVVTAVHGFATGGGGFGLVCASDFVIAGESARFMLAATRVGMAPDAGGSVTLQHLVGFRKAMELAIRNPMLSAVEALELGIINRVVGDPEVMDAAGELAAELAAGPTKAFAETKRLLWNGIGASVEDALPDEARTVSALSGTADSLEGLAAVIERRPPVFAGR